MNVPKNYPEPGTETIENLEMFRDFKGVWIPRDIWFAPLSVLEKCIIVEINSLSKNEDGCFASNKWFSKFFGLSENRITCILTKLKKEGWVTQECFDGRRRSLKADLVNIQTQKDKGRPCRKTRADLVERQIVPNVTPINIKGLQPPLITENIKKSITEPNLAKIQSFVRQFFSSRQKQYPTRVRNVTDSQINQSVDTLDKLVRIDGNPLAQVIEVITWAMTDEFWSPNVLSLVGLRSRSKNGRTKFENIQTGMDREVPASNTSTRPGQPTAPLDSDAQRLLDFVSTVLGNEIIRPAAIQSLVDQMHVFYDRVRTLRFPGNRNQDASPADNISWKRFFDEWLGFLEKKQADRFELQSVNNLAIGGNRWNEYIRLREYLSSYNWTTGKRNLS
jgi:hypothetical protein